MSPFGKMDKLIENENVLSRLEYFIRIRKIPNIVFHGSSGSGKRTIVSDFINKIYNFDRPRIKNYVMFVNCAHGKGIKFIRDELKQFAKTNIQFDDNNLFKSIVMYNADELTIDAQSALRRCIELFSHTTRFFIVVENKHKLLKPILSRFCEIYVPDKNFGSLEAPLYKSLHAVNIEQTYTLANMKKDKREQILDPLFNEILEKGIDVKTHNHRWFMGISNALYEEGISCVEIIEFFEDRITLLDEFGEDKVKEDKVKEDKVRQDIVRTHFCFDKIKSEFRCEKLLMMYIFDYMFLRSDRSLKNVSFL